MPRSSPFGPADTDRDNPAAPEQKPRLALVDRVPPRWILLVLLCAVLIVRGRVMLSFSDSLNNDPDGYREVAWSIYNNGEFAVYDGSWHITAYRPPLYPLLLAVVNFLPGVGWLHVVLGTGTVWAVFRLGLLWDLPPAGALLAAALVTFDPILLNQSVQVMTETLAAFLAAVALAAITRGARDSSIRWSILAGSLFGLCVLCRPTFLAWLIGAVVVIPFCFGSSRRRALAVAFVFALAAALVLSPWARRNQFVFGCPIITTAHGGFTLLLANNPQFYEYLRSGAWGSVWDANQFIRSWKTEADQIPDGTTGVGGQRELAIDALAYQLAFRNIRDEPLMFAYACLVRVGRLWGVMPHQIDPEESTARRLLRYLVAAWYGVELLLAAGGAWLLGRKLLQAPWIWGALLLLSFTAVHTFYWTDLRMRAPLESVVALLAARCVVAIVPRERDATPLLDAT
ncbi:MAG TPA: glycosyltransferase family 39 protein [Pirellulales bacterium]|nr:glycosyltransferase family 39 protein [Pirellulales bacterium]